MPAKLSPEAELDEIFQRHDIFDQQAFQKDLLTWRNKRVGDLEERISDVLDDFHCEWQVVDEDGNYANKKAIDWLRDHLLQAIRGPRTCKECGREMP